MLKQPIIKRIARISPVWIVPIVAFGIAVWLAAQAQMQKGTMIELTFAEASDIQPGQTQIKLKNVKVGLVKSLKLSPDLKSVVVSAEIDRAVSRHLSENTRFWVVTPRISARGVSNLGTLISGVYIVMDPGSEGRSQYEFRGLDETPLLQSGDEGTHYVLQADTLGSLDVGSPVYYRQIRVGEITGYKLANDHQHVDISFFVRSPHDSIVQNRSRFWDVSGFGVSLGADGMKAKMASLTSLIAGGIEFDNSASFGEAKKAEKGHRFYLYADKESVLEERYTIRYYYMLRFSGSVRGLAAGAPVEFRGVKVGVIDVKLNNTDKNEKNLHVYIAVEPQRFFDPNSLPSREEVDARLAAMVAQGLHAKMATSSLLTGSKFIDIEFTKDKIGEIRITKDYTELPTSDDTVAEMANKVDAILAKVEQIPFENIGRDLAASMHSLKGILGTLDESETAQKIDGAMGNLEQTLANAHEALAESEQLISNLNLMLEPDAETRYELTNMLQNVSEAGKSLQVFLDELNRHPNSLIRGAEKDE